MNINKSYFMAAILFSFLAVVVAAKATLDVTQTSQQAGYPVETASASGGGGGCGSGGGGGCGSGGGGGCGSGGGATDPAQLKVIQSQAMQYYVARYKDKTVKADVIDKGCHVEIVILKGQTPVKYLSYRNGQIQEIS